MLTDLQINGFKSFRNFSLSLHSSLNVIVGPNGSGKTNLIRFLEFLANLSSASLVEAVSRSGGAGAIFRQTPKGELEPQFTFSISGDAHWRTRRERSRERIVYKYDAEIVLSLENNVVFFSRQSLALKHSLPARPEKVHRFEIEWKLGDDGNPMMIVGQIDRMFHDGFSFISARNKSEIVQFLNSEIKNDLKDRSFSVIFRHVFDPMEAISEDLASGLSYNIDPNIVRRSEDIAGVPGIKSDGGGLAATLNAAKAYARHTYVNPYYPYRFWHTGPPYERKLLSELANYSRLVNDDITDIDVESDPIENRLRVFLRMSYERGTLKLPLSLASDGTVKWLALVAAVLTNRSVVAVEEPENFLHPYMQREIVNIIRSSCEKSATPTFAIVTTHSETLVNSVSPEELIIFSMKEGSTYAVRPSNAEQLREEIAKTGFGLSYYLLSGAVE